jgi:SSS family solute:Na+ symporter
MLRYIAPPSTATFIVGILWKRATARAGVITLWSGFAMGLVVFGLDFFKKYTGWKWGFMQVSGIMCLICIIMMIVISLMTEDTNTEENLKFVWDNPLTPLTIPGAKGFLNYKFLSVVVLVAACVIYYLFRMPSKEEIMKWRSTHPAYAAKIEAHKKKPVVKPPVTDSEENADISAEIKKEK